MTTTTQVLHLHRKLLTTDPKEEEMYFICDHVDVDRKD